MLTFVFGPFFATIAAEVYLGSGMNEEAADARAQGLWSLCLTVVGLIVGFGAPIIGAVVDVTGRRLPWIIGFSTLYVIRLNVTVVDPTGRVQYVMDALCVWDRFYRRGICVDFYQRPTAQPWPNKVDWKNF